MLSDDGHVSLGEFAFAVRSSAALPAFAAETGTTPWPDVVASWLFFLGLALSLGGLATARLLWRSAVGAFTIIWVGLAATVAGAAWELVLIAGARRGGGFTTGLGASALRAVIGTRPGELTFVVFVSTAIRSGVRFTAVAANRCGRAAARRDRRDGAAWTFRYVG